MARPALEFESSRAFLALAILFAFLTTLAVIGRYVSHWMMRTRWWWDDWLILGALLINYIMIGITLWGLFVAGISQPDEFIDHGDIIILEKQLLILQFPYAFVLALARISIAVFMLKIFPQKWIRIILFLNIFSNTSWLLFVVIDALTICIPLSANWNPNRPPGQCGNFNASYIANAAWGITNDFVLFTAPQFIVWNLNTTWFRRLVLSSVFALGIFDIAVAFVRLCHIVNLDVGSNFACSLSPCEVWSFIESSVAIIVACLPLCKPILDKLVPRHGIDAARHRFSRGRASIADALGSKSTKDKSFRDILESGGEVHINRTVDQTYDVTGTSSNDEEDLAAILARQGNAQTVAHASLAPPRNQWGSLSTEYRIELEEMEYREKMEEKQEEEGQPGSDLEAKETDLGRSDSISTLQEERDAAGGGRGKKMTLIEMLRQ